MSCVKARDQWLWGFWDLDTSMSAVYSMMLVYTVMSVYIVMPVYTVMSVYIVMSIYILMSAYTVMSASSADQGQKCLQQSCLFVFGLH